MGIYRYPWVLPLIVAALTSCSETGFNDDDYLNEGSYNLNWMESIPDDTPLSTLSIPGTYESLTLHGGPHMICQVWSFGTQLKAGLRYFDIHVGNWFLTHQSVDVRDGFWMLWQKTELDEVMKTALDFLETHASETVLLRLTLHGAYRKIIEGLILHLVRQHTAQVWTELSVPSLEQARGKIVLVQSDSFSTGIVYHEPGFPNDHKFKSFEDQVTKVKEYLWIAESICDRHVVLTDTTASSILTSPKMVARGFNSYLNDMVLGYKRIGSLMGCLGVITMNFPSSELIKNIIEINPCVCGGTGDAGGPDHVISGPEKDDGTLAGSRIMTEQGSDSLEEIQTSTEPASDVVEETHSSMEAGSDSAEEIQTTEPESDSVEEITSTTEPGSDSEDDMVATTESWSDSDEERVTTTVSGSDTEEEMVTTTVVMPPGPHDGPIWDITIRGIDENLESTTDPARGSEHEADTPTTTESGSDSGEEIQTTTESGSDSGEEIQTTTESGIDVMEETPTSIEPGSDSTEKIQTTTKAGSESDEEIQTKTESESDSSEEIQTKTEGSDFVEEKQTTEPESDSVKEIQTTEPESEHVEEIQTTEPESEPTSLQPTLSQPRSSLTLTQAGHSQTHQPPSIHNLGSQFPPRSQSGTPNRCKTCISGDENAMR
ncbi:uncharacterized protein LOC115536053 [Gadus morhua]|uniref:uncharacterized protein LOC115536053 n=1 Tax=Gadus morhua TaxID=8049 RepID=UPI0011B479FE|nr:uncharacterized protein LOC115536053 [Gadus morhua]